MIRLSASTRILVATAPVDFRRGIDGLCGYTRNELGSNPSNGCVFVFSNRTRTQARMLYYDGTGYWLMTKRLSKGRFSTWPTDKAVMSAVDSKKLIIYLWGQNPHTEGFAGPWHKVS